MATKKKYRTRLKIAADIYKVFNQKLPKARENKLLKPLFAEMRELDIRAAIRHEKMVQRLAKLPQLCSEYEIFHNRGCGKCKACKDDSGERYYKKQPKFLKT